MPVYSGLTRLFFLILHLSNLFEPSKTLQFEKQAPFSKLFLYSNNHTILSFHPYLHLFSNYSILSYLYKPFIFPNYDYEKYRKNIVSKKAYYPYIYLICHKILDEFIGYKRIEEKLIFCKVDLHSGNLVN